MPFETEPSGERHRCGAIAVVLLVCVALTSCEREEPPLRDERPNVLLIVIDTLRADKLGCYGSTLGLTPHLDAVAAEGTRFERSFAHAPWTLPSFASLLTSTYPAQHGAGGRVGRFQPLPEAARTLAECFRDAGYATRAVVNVDFLSDAFGMNQGYAAEDYDFYAVPANNIEMRRATATTDAAIRWLRGRRGDRSFFVMVHYFDPHLVYDPPTEYRRRFAAPQDRDNHDWVYGTVPDVIALRNGKAKLNPDTIRRGGKLYDGEVAYTDAEIGRLLDEVSNLGLNASTILVITADHGEEFLDHGGFEHGHTLYDELIHVPLLFRYPGRLPVKVVSPTVGLIDVAPTLCQLAGVDPEPSFVGRSLLPLVDDEEVEDRPILSQGNFWGPPLFSWRHGGYKIVLSKGQTALYHVSFDPLEQINLASVEPGIHDEMRANLAVAVKSARSRRWTGRGNQRPAVTLLPAELERLRALGYAVGTGAPTEKPPSWEDTSSSALDEVLQSTGE